jgi:hypothetical protein
MTRINTGIHPSELTRQHLLAEHRELVRIPNCVKKGRYNLKGTPEQFTLGTGHVKFFYTRLKYLHKRYESIKVECIKRGYNITNYSNCFENLPVELYNDYQETERDRKLLQERIAERLNTSLNKSLT